LRSRSLLGPCGPPTLRSQAHGSQPTGPTPANPTPPQQQPQPTPARPLHITEFSRGNELVPQSRNGLAPRSHLAPLRLSTSGSAGAPDPLRCAARISRSAVPTRFARNAGPGACFAFSKRVPSQAQNSLPSWTRTSRSRSAEAHCSLARVAQATAARGDTPAPRPLGKPWRQMGRS
jgi:hypothetical protein